MKEQEALEITSENRYADTKGNNMPDLGMENKPGDAGQNRVELAQQEPVSPDKKVDEEAKKTVLETAKKEVLKEEQGERVQQNQTETTQVVKQKAEKYVPKAPPEIADVVNNFYREFASQGEVVSTQFLISSYVKLRTAAEKKGISRDFLSGIERELANRNITNTNALFDAYKGARVIVKSWRQAVKDHKATPLEAERGTEHGEMPKWSGGSGEEEDRYKSVAIEEAVNSLKEGTKVYIELEALNRWLQAYGAPELESIQKTFNEIAKMQVPLDATPEEKDAFPKDKEIALNALKSEIDSIRKGQKKREDERGKEEMVKRGKGWYWERLISYDEQQEILAEIKKVVREEADPDAPMSKLLGKLGYTDSVFNRMFDKAESSPRTDFEKAMGMAGSQEHQIWTSMLNTFKEELVADLTKDKFSPQEKMEKRREINLLERLISKYATEYKLRELLHNAYFIAETGGEAKDFAGYTKQFQSEFMDLSFLEAPEVEVALRMREQVLYQIKRENGGRIPYEKIAWIPGQGWSEWDKRVRQMLRDANEKKLLGGDSIDEWRVEKALSLSRGLGMITLRFPEIVAECPLSAPMGTNEAQPSIPWETIAWELNPLDHKIKRYDIAAAAGQAILYAPVKRNKPWYKFWSQDELKNAMANKTLSTLSEADGQRLIDLRSLSKMGGPNTHSSWRGYAAALNDERSELRVLLEQNPGLNNKLLWNAYRIKGLADEKKKFIQGYIKERPDTDVNRDPDFLKSWQAREAQLKAELKVTDEYKKANMDAWQNSAARIPHVILRIITDESNNILSKAETNALRAEIFGNLSENDLKNAITETESDLTFAKERLMQRRREAMARMPEFENNPQKQQKQREWLAQNFVDRITPEDLDLIVGETGTPRRDRADKMLKCVTTELGTNNSLREKLFKKFEDSDFAFAVTMEDVAWGEFRFAQTGGRGFITRRNNDWYEEVEANNAMIELVKKFQRFGTPEEMVAQLGKIYDFAEVHDKDRARQYIEFLAKGIIRFCEKDGIMKIPVFGEVFSLLNPLRGKGNSFAQTAFGIYAPDWDSDDIYNFTEQLRKVLTGPEGLKAIDRIRKETGGTLLQALGKKTKIAWYLLMIFGSYEFLDKLISEK